MLSHSSILAWRIAMDRGARWAAVQGSERVGHDERLSALPGLTCGAWGLCRHCNMRDLSVVSCELLAVVCGI